MLRSARAFAESVGRSGRLQVFFHILFFLFLLILAIALIRDTRYQGQDFEVFWKTGGHLLRGEPLYLLERDGAMVFKYPPWIATLFLPFALLPLEFAKWTWGLVQVLSLGFLFRSFLSLGVSSAKPWITALLFWGIWAVHALDGQIMLPVLALLWCGRNLKHPVLRGLLISLTAVKGVTSLAAIHEAQGDAKKVPQRFLKVALLGLFGVALLLVPLFILSPTPLAEWIGDWWRAANSGNAAFGWDKILGRENQSFTALVLRGVFHAGLDPGPWVLPTTAGLSLVGAILWWRASRMLSNEIRLAGWLALVPLVHPLSWIHGFTWVFPLAVLVRPGTLTWIGVLMVGVLTEKTLGTAGLALELLSIKSWGVLLLFRDTRRDLSGEVGAF